jgi:vacuolar protein sorting-associated protein 35
MYDSNMMDQGGSLISRTANLMGTLGISSSPMPNDPFASGKGPTRIAQFREEQSLVAKLLHVLDHEDTDVTYQMLNVARKYLQPGGPERVSVTMPALVFASLKLLRQVQQLEFPVRIEVGQDISGQNGEEAPKDLKQETTAEEEESKEKLDKDTSDKNEDKPDDKGEEETEAQSKDKEARAEEGDNIGDAVVEENAEANSNTQADAALDTVEKETASAATPDPLFEAFTKTVK